MKSRSSLMAVSPRWLQISVLTFLLGFAVLGYLAYRIYTDHPPVPDQVVTEDGSLLFTGSDILAGQHIFQKYGLMQHGTIFGHGAYLGPDFTAQYLHDAGQTMRKFYLSGSQRQADVEERIRREFKQNTFDPETGKLVYSAGQAQAFAQLKDTTASISAK